MPGYIIFNPGKIKIKSNAGTHSMKEISGNGKR